MTDTKQDLENAIKLLEANEIANRFGFKVEIKPTEINLDLSYGYNPKLHSVDEYYGFAKGFELARASLK